MSQTQKLEDTKMVVKCDPDLVMDLQVADIEFRSQRDAIIAILDQHSRDLKDRITDTPIFTGMFNQAAQAYKDYLGLKTKLEQSWDIDASKEIVSWKLSYETNEAVVELADKLNVQTRDFLVTDDLVDAVQKAHVLYDAATAIISTMIEMHSTDAKDTITTSVTYKGFQKIKAHYYEEFNAAKKAMFSATASSECNIDDNWKLDYHTKVLKVQI